jgi:hypothetical protein
MRRTAAALLLMLSALPTGGAAGATTTAADASQTAADPEALAREEVLWQTVNDLKTRLDGVEVDFELEKGKSRRLEGEVGRLRARVEVLESRAGHGSSSSVDRRRLGDSPGETQIIHKRRLAYQHKCAGPGEQNGECPYGCVCSPPTWPNCGTVPPPDCSGRHRRTQKAEVCTEAEVPQRLNAINWECCDETTESCRSGTPEKCNIGCAAVVLPFWAECRAPFIRTVSQGIVDTFREVVDKCQRNESAGVKTSLATEFALVCESHNVTNCIPDCTEALHGHILLATVDGDDSAYTCEVHHGMYSWNGKAGAGGFIGSDVRSFIASVLSGAGGFYVALIIENNARVDVELLVRPQQTVSIRGDPGVQSDGGSSQPIWGFGGFTVQQYGSLRLKNLVIAAALAVSTGGHATVEGTVFAAGTSVAVSGAAAQLALSGCTLQANATLSVSGGGHLSLASMQLSTALLRSFLEGGNGLRDQGSVVALAQVDVSVINRQLTGTITATSSPGTRQYQPPGLLYFVNLSAFFVVSGPCTTRDGGRCVGRPHGYGPNERCEIVVARGGVLGPCPVFQVRCTLSHGIHTPPYPRRCHLAHPLRADRRLSSRRWGDQPELSKAARCSERGVYRRPLLWRPGLRPPARPWRV